MKIIIKPNTMKARSSLRNWASFPIADYSIEVEEDPFQVVATPLGKIATCFASGDINSEIKPKKLPKKLGNWANKFAGQTFAKILETFFRSSIQKSQRLTKKDIEVFISNE